MKIILRLININHISSNLTLSLQKCNQIPLFFYVTIMFGVVDIFRKGSKEYIVR